MQHRVPVLGKRQFRRCLFPLPSGGYVFQQFVDLRSRLKNGRSGFLVSRSLAFFLTTLGFCFLSFSRSHQLLGDFKSFQIGISFNWVTQESSFWLGPFPLGFRSTQCFLVVLILESCTICTITQQDRKERFETGAFCGSPDDQFGAVGPHRTGAWQGRQFKEEIPCAALRK